MLFDDGIILATNEAPPNQGAIPGGLGEDSVNLAVDLGVVQGNRYGEAGTVVISDLGAAEMELEIQVDTSFSAVEPVTGNGYAEFAVVSLPLALSLLSDGAGGASDGKLTSALVSLTDTTDLVEDLTGHGLAPGTPVYISDLDGAVIVGYAANQRAYVSANGMTANAFKLAATRAAALDPAGAVLDITTSNVGVGAVLEFQVYVHATTGRVPLDCLQAGAVFVARTMPWSVYRTADSSVPYAGAVGVPHGSSKGQAGINPGFLPVPGRYLALQVLAYAALGTAGRYSANLGVNAHGGVRHSHSAFQVL